MNHPSVLETAQNAHLAPDDYVIGNLMIVPMVIGKAKSQLGYSGEYGKVGPWLAQRFKFPVLFTFERKQHPYPVVWRDTH
jgi:hypothetical protein